MHRTVALVLACAIATTAACSSRDPDRARRDAETADLHAQLADYKKNQDAGARERARLADQVKALDAQQAFVLAETKATRQEIDQAQRELNQISATLRELRASIEEIDRKASAPPAPAPVSGAPAKPGAAAPRDASPEKLYATAMASFRGEAHGQAVTEFAEVIDRFPQHPLASNAQYWIGETYYRQRDFRQALVEFEKVVDGYPQSAQIPEALLKIGLCQRALKDTAAARESLERLVKNYPGTNAATQARSLISQLGGAGRTTR